MTTMNDQTEQTEFQPSSPLLLRVAFPEVQLLHLARSIAERAGCLSQIFSCAVFLFDKKKKKKVSALTNFNFMTEYPWERWGKKYHSHRFWSAGRRWLPREP